MSDAGHARATLRTALDTWFDHRADDISLLSADRGWCAGHRRPWHPAGTDLVLPLRPGPVCFRRRRGQRDEWQPPGLDRALGLVWSPSGATAAGTLATPDGAVHPWVAQPATRTLLIPDVPARPLPQPAWGGADRVLFAAASPSRPSPVPGPEVFEPEPGRHVRVLPAGPRPEPVEIHALDPSTGASQPLPLPAGHYGQLAACGEWLAAVGGDGGRPTVTVVALGEDRRGGAGRPADQGPQAHELGGRPLSIRWSPGGDRTRLVTLLEVGENLAVRALDPETGTWHTPTDHPVGSPADVLPADRSRRRAAGSGTSPQRWPLPAVIDDLTPAGHVTAVVHPPLDPPAAVGTLVWIEIGPDEAVAGAPATSPAGVTGMTEVAGVAGDAGGGPDTADSPVWHTVHGYLVVRLRLSLAWWASTPDGALRARLVELVTGALDSAAVASAAVPGPTFVGGHSFAATVALLLLADTRRMTAAIVRSGAYSRQITMLGFQSESRTLWEAPVVYRDFDMIVNADRIDRPVLATHGRADTNPATPHLQASLLHQALVANGTPCRLVLLPHDGHAYRSRDGITTALVEEATWLHRWTA